MKISQHASSYFEVSETSMTDILKLVEKLSTRKASGLDNIPVFSLEVERTYNN
jgi:hypothetical protein